MHRFRRKRLISLRWLLLLPLAMLLMLAFQQLVDMPAEASLPPPAPAAQGILLGLSDALPPESSPAPHRAERVILWELADTQPEISISLPKPAADSQGTPLLARQYRRSFYLAFPPGDMPG